MPKPALTGDLSVYLIDVNVVLAAHRSDHGLYKKVRPWFDDLMAGDEPFSVPVGMWASFLRLATNRKLFPIPTPRAEAFAFLDAVRSQPHHLTLEPGPRHLALLRTQCDDADAVGNLVPDAVLAALAVEHGCIIATADRDFARFPSVRHELVTR